MTKPKNLADAILKELEQYSKTVTEEVEIAKVDVAKALNKELKVVDIKLTGDYKKGWRVKKVKKSYFVHNKTDYQLTHLLENGYVQKDGKRKAGRPHIRPAEQRAIKAYLKKIEKAVKA